MSRNNTFRVRRTSALGSVISGIQRGQVDGWLQKNNFQVEGIGLGPGASAIIGAASNGYVSEVDVQTIHSSAEHTTVKTTVTVNKDEPTICSTKDDVEKRYESHSVWSIRYPKTEEGESVATSFNAFEGRMNQDYLVMRGAGRAIEILLVFLASLRDNETHYLEDMFIYNTNLQSEDGERKNRKTVMYVSVAKYEADEEKVVEGEGEESDSDSGSTDSMPELELVDEDEDEDKVNHNSFVVLGEDEESDHETDDDLPADDSDADDEES